MRKIVALFLGFLLSWSAFAQMNITLTESDLRIDTRLPELFTEHSLVQMDYLQVSQSLDPEEVSRMSWTLPDGKKWDMELYPSQIAADDLLVRIIEASGEKVQIGAQAVAYYGRLSDDIDSHIRLTVNGPFISGYIQTKKRTMFIEPASDLDQRIPEGHYALYDVSDIKNTGDVKCHATDAELERRRIGNPEELPSGQQRGPDDCFTVELAVYADYDYFLDEGSTIGDATNQIIAVMNTVAPEYEYNGSNNFESGVEFEIVEMVISRCEACDIIGPSTDIGYLLNQFTAWSPDGFRLSHDLGQYWTGRNLPGGTIGLAWVNAVCSNVRYHVLENYSNTTWQLRVLTAHEIGHNFSANHDAGGSNFIMAPSITNTSTWSTLSKNTVNANLDVYASTCLADCGSDPCPTVEDVVISQITTTGFRITYSATPDNSYRIRVREQGATTYLSTQTTSSENIVISPSGWNECGIYEVSVENNCGGGDYSAPVIALVVAEIDACPYFNSPAVGYKDESLNFAHVGTPATSYLWTFGDGATSSSATPSHSYTSDGVYTVTLEVNGNGVQESKIVTVLPDLNPPYFPSDGGNFGTNPDHFAADSPDGIPAWERGVPSGALTNDGDVWKTGLTTDAPERPNTSYLYSPRFNFSGEGNYDLSLRVGMDRLFAVGPYGLRMQYSLDDGASWTTLGNCGENGDPGVSNWYESGGCGGQDIFNTIFSDRISWNFGNLSEVRTSTYDLNFLEGNASVCFRFEYASTVGFPSSAFRDGFLLDNFTINYDGDPPGDPCDGFNLTLGTADYPGTFKAKNTITAGGTISGGTVILEAENGFDIQNGFEVQVGSTLEMNIDPCDL